MPAQRRPASAVLIPTIVLLVGCGKTEEASEKSRAEGSPQGLPVVVVETSERRTIRPGFAFPAIVEATDRAVLLPQVQATIEKRHFTPGALVDEGDLLFQLDDSDYRIAADKARAALEAATAVQFQAERELARAEKLLPTKAVSELYYEQKEAEAKAAAAATSTAEANLKDAELDLRRTRIHAPFAGKVGASNYAVGDLVSPGSPATTRPLCELVKLDPIYALAQVDQKVYVDFRSHVVALEAQGETVPRLEVIIELPNGTEYPHRGELENWDPSGVASAGTLGARALFPNPDLLLLPGENVTVRGRLIQEIDAVLVPQKAVSQDQQGHYVLTVSADGTVRRQNVEMGLRHGADWIVREGLEPGERVIVEGLQKARPGQRVDIQRTDD